MSLVVILTLALAALWAAWALQTALVPSESMSPTLQTGDILLVRKDAYRKGRTPQRGDIVLFKRKGVSDYFVKRVIGLPGDTIIVESGYVSINGQSLHEPYLGGEMVHEWPGYLHLGNDEYFVMGDNRAHSEDSRDTGAVKRADITGKVAAIIAPRDRRRSIVNPFAD